MIHVFIGVFCPPSVGVGLGYLSGLVGVILERWGAGPTPCFPCPDKENPGFDPPRPPYIYIYPDIYIGGGNPKFGVFDPRKPPNSGFPGVPGGPRGPPPGTPSPGAPRGPPPGAPRGPPPGTPKSGSPGAPRPGPPNRGSPAGGPQIPKFGPRGPNSGISPEIGQTPQNRENPDLGGFASLSKTD